MLYEVIIGREAAGGQRRVRLVQKQSWLSGIACKCKKNCFKAKYNNHTVIHDILSFFSR